MIRKPLDIKPGEKSFKIRAARFYSDLLSPPSAFAIFGFIIAWSELPFWKGSLHAAIFGALTSLMPLVYILWLLKRGDLSDIHISNPNERRIPYILGIVGAVIAFFVIKSLESSQLFLNFILTNIFGLGTLALINSRWLISAHTASITTITLFAGYAFCPLISLILTPLIFTTFYIRLYLKRHSIWELVSGIIVGIVIVSGLIVLGVL